MMSMIQAIAPFILALALVELALPAEAAAQRPPRNRPASKASSPDSAPGSGRVAADRWIPSLALEGGFSFQRWKAGVSSQVCRGCPIPGPGVEELQPGDHEDDRDSTALIGIQLELMSPELHLPGRPRFFFGAEIAPTFGNERDIASTGNPARTVGSPRPDSPNSVFSEDFALGQGAVVTMKRDELTFGASAGFRPSFNWIRFDVELDGLVSDADCAARCNTTPAGPGFLRETQFHTSTDETFDGIGPGLHIEMEAARMGPIRTTVFGGARIYRILGDKDIGIRAGPITISDQLGTDQSAARFDFDVDDWLYRFGIGVRIQWMGGSYGRPPR
jgi:hypothetical protein